MTTTEISTCSMCLSGRHVRCQASSSRVCTCNICKEDRVRAGKKQKPIRKGVYRPRTPEQRERDSRTEKKNRQARKMAELDCDPRLWDESKLSELAGELLDFVKKEHDIPDKLIEIGEEWVDDGQHSALLLLLDQGIHW